MLLACMVVYLNCLFFILNLIIFILYATGIYSCIINSIKLIIEFIYYTTIICYRYSCIINKIKLIILIIYYTTIICCFICNGCIYICNGCIDFVFSAEISHLNEYNYNTSGNNNNFDPVRDAINTNNNHNNYPNNPGPNNPGGNTNPPTGNNSVATYKTDTDQLADFLETKKYGTIRSAGIRFKNLDNVESSLQFYSRVMICVRIENPGIFVSRVDATTLTDPFIDYIRGLHKNYIFTVA